MTMSRLLVFLVFIVPTVAWAHGGAVVVVVWGLGALVALAVAIIGGICYFVLRRKSRAGNSKHWAVSLMLLGLAISLGIPAAAVLAQMFGSDGVEDLGAGFRLLILNYGSLCLSTVLWATSA